MHSPPRILIVDDNATNRDILGTRLARRATSWCRPPTAKRRSTPRRTARSAPARRHDAEARRLRGLPPVRADPTLPFMPIILVTARDDLGCRGRPRSRRRRVSDQAGRPAALIARVRSMLRIKALHDKVQEQAAQLADWNRTLEQRVADQLAEIERMSRLKRFLSPQVAELCRRRAARICSTATARDVTVVFCDLRGFTAFAETAEPEEVMTVVREYHAAVGALIHRIRGHAGAVRRRRPPGAVQRSDALSGSGLRRGAHGGQHARAVSRARRQLAQARARARLRHRHRARLRHARPDRLRGPLRLRCDRHGGQSRGTAVRGRQVRSDPDRRQGLFGDRGSDRRGAGGRPDAERLPPADQGVQRTGRCGYRRNILPQGPSCSGARSLVFSAARRRSRSRRRGGVCTAGSGAPHRRAVRPCRGRSGFAAAADLVRAGAARSRLDQGAQPQGRLPLGRRWRHVARECGAARQTEAGIDPGKQHAGGDRAAGADAHGAGRVRAGHRSGRPGLRRQSGAARRQSDRHHQFRILGRQQMDRDAHGYRAAACAGGGRVQSRYRAVCRPVRPADLGHRGDVQGDADGRWRRASLPASSG